MISEVVAPFFWQKSRRFRLGAGNGSNLAALYCHSQQQQEQRRRRGEAVVVRASEVAVKEESGTPSLGLEVVETLVANSRVLNPLSFLCFFSVTFFALVLNLKSWSLFDSVVEPVYNGDGSFWFG